MWASLKAPVSDDPRWPDVPKATRCAGSAGSGAASWYAASNRSTSTRSAGSAGRPARGSIAIGPPLGPIVTHPVPRHGLSRQVSSGRASSAGCWTRASRRTSATNARARGASDGDGPTGVGRRQQPADRLRGGRPGGRVAGVERRCLVVRPDVDEHAGQGRHEDDRREDAGDADRSTGRLSRGEHDRGGQDRDRGPGDELASLGPVPQQEQLESDADGPCGSQREHAAAHRTRAGEVVGFG